MFKYRDNRRTLTESMATKQEFKSKKELVDYLQESLEIYGDHGHDCSKIKIERYGYGEGVDKRNGWETHIVYLEGYGVFGFIDLCLS